MKILRHDYSPREVIRIVIKASAMNGKGLTHIFDRRWMPVSGSPFKYHNCLFFWKSSRYRSPRYYIFSKNVITIDGDLLVPSAFVVSGSRQDSSVVRNRDGPCYKQDHICIKWNSHKQEEMQTSYLKLFFTRKILKTSVFKIKKKLNMIF